MSDLSVITLTRNRSLHLSRLINGLGRSSLHPCELIVVDMGGEPVNIPEMPFSIRKETITSSHLPLAAARNLGARSSKGERLLFLDVDCIPRSSLIETMDAALVRDDALICAEVLYLGPHVQEFSTDQKLLSVAVPHPARQFPDRGVRDEINAGLFWSLAFGIRRDTFERVDGFDEGFEGYGAEDTDFSFRARAAAIRLSMLGGTGAFHQYHGVMSPPLQHFADIVRNANLFYRRWKMWPMTGWLEQFQSMGLVDFGPHHLKIVRDPTAQDLADAQQPPTVYF